MTFITIIKLVLKMMRTNGSRSLLTILGVSVGVAAIYGFIGVGFGLQRVTESTIATAETLTTLDVLSPSEQLPLTPDRAQAWREIPNVEDVSALLTVPSQVRFNDKVSDAQLNIVDPAYLRYAGLNVLHGKSLDAAPGRYIVVSSAMAKIFGVDNAEDLIDQEVLFALFVEQDDGSESIVQQKEPFVVAGVYEDDQLSQAFVAFEHVPEVHPAYYHAVKIKIDNKDNIIAVRNRIADEGFTVSSVTDFLEQVDKVFSVVQTVLAIFGFIALFVSAIGMFNTMTIALLERTHDIGIMKSVGVENSSIWKMFVTESSLIGLFGGLIGVLFGIMIGELLNAGVNMLAESLGGDPVDIFYTPLWFLVTILVVSAVVGVITGFYPARRASRINPLDALRYE